MGRIVGAASRTGVTGRLREELVRAALPIAALATAAVLVVVFYYPVGTVLVEAIVSDGRLTAGPVRDVLASPFYFGVAHHLFADPFGVPAGILAWARAGFPAVGFGLVGFTVYQALLSTVASLVLGIPGAYLLARFSFRGRETVRALTMLPFVLPSIMVAIGFVAMFGDSGTLNSVLTALGLPTISLIYTLELVVLAHAFYNAPLVTRLVATSWESVDDRMIETARSLGASRSRAFLDVVVPQLLPGALTAALLTFLFTFMSFPIVLALGGLELATIEVWLYARVQQLQLTQAAGLAVVETIITLGVTYVYVWYETDGEGLARLGTGASREPLFVSRPDPRRIGLFVYAGVVLVVFVGPILSMIVESLTGPDGLTLQYYSFLVQRQVEGASFQVKPVAAVTNSIVFAFGTLALAMPMGVLIAVVSTREFVGNRVTEAVLMAPLAVSGIVVGLGLLQGLVFGTTVFGHRLTATGPVVIVAAHSVAAYPFVTRNVVPMLRSVDQHLLESARSLGASRYRAFADVEVPLVIPGLLAGAAFAFAISVGEFDSTVILAAGSSSYTMPVAVERYLGNRTLGPATAMGTVLLFVTAVSFVVIDRMGGRYEP